MKRRRRYGWVGAGVVLGVTLSVTAGCGRDESRLERIEVTVANYEVDQDPAVLQYEREFARLNERLAKLQSDSDKLAAEVASDYIPDLKSSDQPAGEAEGKQ
jgi:hypothetical protein